MKISLKNVGKLKSANIEIDGITVIAGENDTGKSTVGKALFSIFNSCYNLDNEIKETQKSLFVKYLKKLSWLNSDTSISIADEILYDTKKYLNKNNTEELEVLLTEEDYMNESSEVDIVNILEKFEEVLNLKKEEIVKIILKNQLVVEFNNQFKTINSEEPAYLSLTLKNEKIELHVNSKNDVDICSPVQIYTQAIYYDNPFILDNIKNTNNMGNKCLNHSDFMKYCLLNDKIENKFEDAILDIIVNTKIDDILSNLNKIVDGEMKKINSRKIVYTYSNDDIQLDIANLSTGMKAFVVLKTLLLKGYIEENGTIILDEPEVHLHPKWQLSFAELIVLLQKKFNLHILLNTHSPYFLRAIQVFSDKHNIEDRCKYYLAENEGNMSVINDVTEDIEKIYKKLASPLQELEGILYE